MRPSAPGGANRFNAHRGALEDGVDASSSWGVLRGHECGSEGTWNDARCERPQDAPGIALELELLEVAARHVLAHVCLKLDYPSRILRWGEVLHVCSRRRQQQRATG
jgi:hypothetical protein